MIKSFRCRNTEALFNDASVKKFEGFERVARRKLEMLTAARRLEDLRVPPGNRLEPLIPTAISTDTLSSRHPRATTWESPCGEGGDPRKRQIELKLRAWMDPGRRAPRAFARRRDDVRWALRQSLNFMRTV